MDPSLLTVPEVADALRCSVRTVRRLVESPSDAIPHVRIGRRLLVQADDLANWLQGRRCVESAAGALVRAAFEGRPCAGAGRPSLSA